MSGFSRVVVHFGRGYLNKNDALPKCFLLFQGENKPLEFREDELHQVLRRHVGVARHVDHQLTHDAVRNDPCPVAANVRVICMFAGAQMRVSGRAKHTLTQKCT